VVQELLQHNDIQIDAQAKYTQHTPLYLAAREGHSSVVAVLLQRGANINAQSDDLVTPLHAAARNGHKAVVQELVQHDDIQIDAKDDAGATPLAWAAKEGHSSVVAVLLQSGANINAQIHDLRTPLHVAATYGHKAVVQELLQNGEININPRDKLGRTPLVYAEDENHPDIAQLLKEHGATE